jgi:hypothetical protein
LETPSEKRIFLDAVLYGVCDVGFGAMPNPGSINNFGEIGEAGLPAKDPVRLFWVRD